MNNLTADQVAAMNKWHAVVDGLAQLRTDKPPVPKYRIEEAQRILDDRWKICLGLFPGLKSKYGLRD